MQDSSSNILAKFNSVGALSITPVINTDAQIALTATGTAQATFNFNTAGGTGIFQFDSSGNFVFRQSSGTGSLYYDYRTAIYFRDAANSFNNKLVYNGTTLATQSGFILGWSSSSTDATATKDTGIDREAAGLIGINNGTAGTFRDLKVRQHYIDYTYTAGGTTGAQTINGKGAWSVNFAAAATSLVVTSDLITTNSMVICTIMTNDATLKSVQAVTAAGSVTLYANAAATAETKCACVVINK